VNVSIFKLTVTAPPMLSGGVGFDVVSNQASIQKFIQKIFIKNIFLNQS